MEVIQPEECSLDDNIAAYERKKPEPERQAWGKWVVFNEGKLIANGSSVGFETEAAAVEIAISFLKDKKHPLMRRVGEKHYLRPNGAANSFLPDTPSPAA